MMVIGLLLVLGLVGYLLVCAVIVLFGGVTIACAFHADRTGTTFGYLKPALITAVIVGALMLALCTR